MRRRRKGHPVSALFAFLHHLTAFALVAALAAEFVLIRAPLDAATARRLALADGVYGVSAGLVLAVGAARVIWFEKGAAYYLHSASFIAKLVLFLLVGLSSIRPTLTFLSWNRSARRGSLPVADTAVVRRIRATIHAELAGVVLILLCAALMSHGVGYFGA